MTKRRKGTGRKKQKAPKRPRKRSPKAPSVFQRVRVTSAAPSAVKRANPALARIESERRNVERILIARGVDPETSRHIAHDMDPEKPYLIDIYGRKASPKGSDSESSVDDMIVKQASFVGNGRSLWARLINYANRGDIDGVDIIELGYGINDRPLWGPQSVVTIDGEMIYGHGEIEEYRDRVKMGRPKKPGGGMTADQRRKFRRGKKAALERKHALDERVKQLKKTDPVAAARLLERSKARRKYFKDKR